MFIYNIKLSGTKMFKCLFILICIIVICLFLFGVYQIFHKATSAFHLSDQVNSKEVKDISPKNYTNILKASNENIDSYIGNQIHFIGYVYRLYDFSEEQFVLARDMLITSDRQSVVVGFLCQSKEAKNFKDGAWVEITGEITKGNYNGDIAMIKIKQIKEAQKPSDEFVYPPDDTYIPTSTIF